MSDSSAIDGALATLILSDTVLAGICVDGVYFDIAAQNAQRFVIISLVEEYDDLVFGKRAFENPLYLVKAVALASTGADVKLAAARIDALLEQGSLQATGFAVTGMYREKRVRYTEVDEVDPSIRWQHRGGHYRICAGVS